MIRCVIVQLRESGYDLLRHRQDETGRWWTAAYGPFTEFADAEDFARGESLLVVDGPLGDFAATAWREGRPIEWSAYSESSAAVRP